MVGLMDALAGAPAVKVALTGRAGVGKTALANHAARSAWEGTFPETLGSSVIDAVDAERGRGYELWDVGARHAANHPRANVEQLRGVRAVVHLFSFSDRVSLASVRDDLASIRAAMPAAGVDPAAVPVILVGTKRDAVSSCQLSVHEARLEAEACGLPVTFVDSPPAELEDLEYRGDYAVRELFDALAEAVPVSP